MPYEPIFPDIRADSVMVDNSLDRVTVLVETGGRLYTGCKRLGEAWDAAVGPMSLESGAMSVVREICQRICSQERGQRALEKARTTGDQS